MSCMEGHMTLQQCRKTRIRRIDKSPIVGQPTRQQAFMLLLERLLTEQWLASQPMLFQADTQAAAGAQAASALATGAQAASSRRYSSNHLMQRLNQLLMNAFRNQHFKQQLVKQIHSRLQRCWTIYCLKLLNGIPASTGVPRSSS